MNRPPEIDLYIGAGRAPGAFIEWLEGKLGCMGGWSSTTKSLERIIVKWLKKLLGLK